MHKEIKSVINRLKITNTKEPWFGKPVYSILEEVNTKKVSLRPNDTEHSMIELLYHMNTWAGFTLKRIEKHPDMDIATFEKMDWREIKPDIHTWKKGMAEFRSLQKKIIKTLNKKDDSFLKEIVDFRKYNYQFLLHGMIEHNIYHIG